MSEVKPTEQQSMVEAVALGLLVLVWDFFELVAASVLLLTVSVYVAVVLELPLLAVPVLVVGIALVVVVVAGSGVRQQVGRVRARRRRRLFRRNWPAMCDRLGWSARLQAHAGEQPSVNPGLVPDLLSYGGGASGLWVEIKPLSNQPRKKWPEMSDALARFYGMPHQRWSEPRPGVLRIDLIASELPSSVAYVPELHDSEAWDDFILAVDAAGDLVHWKPSEVPHVLVGGITQGGKGSVLRRMMHHGLRTGWQLLAINPKGSGEFGWVEDLGVPVFTDISMASRAVEWVVAEMKRRQAIVGAHKVNNWRRLPNPSIMPPLMVLIDEGSSLLLINRANKETQKQQEQTGDGLAKVGMQGRAVGIHLVMVAQRPDAAHLGPAGGSLRMNLDGRIAVCNVDGDGRRMMFDNIDDPDILRHLDGTKGRALMTRLTTGSMDVFPAQVIYADEEDLNVRPPRVKVRQLADGLRPLGFLDDGAAA